MIKVAPSILAADFAHLADELKNLTAAGADMVHIDVMDGSFVPNITIGSPVVKSLRSVSNLLFDVHLMTEHPETQINSFAEAGADIITFHIETTAHANRLVQSIKAQGKKAAVALNPATPIAMVEELLPYVDMVLVMTVNPGFGGQKFIDGRKIAVLHKLAVERGLSFDIEVDGGINKTTAKTVRQLGANVLVAGSAVFGAADMKTAIAEIRGD